MTAGALRRVAAALRISATRLRDGERDDVSVAVDTVRQQARGAAFDLDAAAHRHGEAAETLDEYAEAVEDRHRRDTDAEMRRMRLSLEVEEARRRLMRLELVRADTADPWSTASLAQEIQLEVERLDSLRERRREVDAEERAADLALQAAADRAVARLDSLAWEDQSGAGLRWEAGLGAGVVALGAAAALMAASPLGLSALIGLAGPLVGTVRSRIDAEVQASAPLVTETLGAGEGAPSPRRPAEALGEAAEVDALGRADRTVVKITELVGPDGTVRWRVALPSTQDWNFGARDAGAVNDLDANLTLMLAPHERTQYERGVLDAMRQAGVGREDPVLLVGFSQGGIMAAHPAAHRTEHRWAGIIVAGAPVGAMRIPVGTEVVAVEHHGDPVPRLERDFGLAELSPDRHGWSTIRTASAGSGEGVAGIHSARQYDATLQRHGVELEARHPSLADFYSNSARTVSRHYTWREGEG